MSGAFGGERSAVFHYRDITGLEYNSGIMSGVLEILTPSYQGSTNKDFWRGYGRSPNRNTDNPWALNNCLPLAKLEYKAHVDVIKEVRHRISQAKESPVSEVANPQASASRSLPDELRKLADLADSGILTPEEFAAAKARLLADT